MRIKTNKMAEEQKNMLNYDNELREKIENCDFHNL